MNVRRQRVTVSLRQNTESDPPNKAQTAPAARSYRRQHPPASGSDKVHLGRNLLQAALPLAAIARKHPIKTHRNAAQGSNSSITDGLGLESAFLGPSEFSQLLWDSRSSVPDHSPACPAPARPFARRFPLFLSGCPIPFGARHVRPRPSLEAVGLEAQGVCL